MKGKDLKRSGMEKMRDEKRISQVWWIEREKIWELSRIISEYEYTRYLSDTVTFYPSVFLFYVCILYFYLYVFFLTRRCRLF